MQDVDNIVRKLQQQILEQARKRYSETVIDHWMNIRNWGAMENPNGHGKIKGPCGDTMEIFIRVRDGIIAEARFMTDGCITSTASGSMTVEMATHKEISQARAISQEDILERLGGLPEESQHCALLASNTLRVAIDDYLATTKESWKKLYRPKSQR
ncbi:iron-sulfur cluster assembly scaffold protein [Acidobacteriota bacterium]